MESKQKKQNGLKHDPLRSRINTVLFWILLGEINLIAYLTAYKWWSLFISGIMFGGALAFAVDYMLIKIICLYREAVDSIQSSIEKMIKKMNNQNNIPKGDDIVYFG